ncbi:isocitrate lyase/phosphoenolpyruvate mutase family protein [Rhodobacteraceae bacterium D3-12]|nr:isocitrate lyase/phosphoenolpyruvate mutase family protein [Rhodobacteraceae bacterium D3-12]
MTLRERLSRPEILIAPGCYDALSALLIQQAGFEAAYLSGASVSYTRFGLPDIGLVGMNEMAQTLRAIADRVDLPLIVDGDTGFGNALNVQRTVQSYRTSGAGAIQIEDQTFPKRCGHLDNKQLITTAAMTGKLRAADDARGDSDMLIVARTDAVAVEGMEAALERAEAYIEAGADMLFVEAPPTTDALQMVGEKLGHRIPLMANMVEGGKTPLSSAHDLQEMGYSMVIFPGAFVRALAWAGQAFFASLHEHGTTRPFADRMHDFQSLNDVLDTPGFIARGKTYEE